MNRRDFLRTLVGVAVSSVLPLPIPLKNPYKVVGTITGRTASVGDLHLQFLQKRHLAKMWLFASNYGSTKERFIENLDRIDAEPLAIYRNYKKLFIADFKEIELLSMVRRQRCNGRAKIVQ